MIPLFKNTEHAEQYGRENKGNGEVIALLKEEREKLTGVFKRLMKEGKEGQALYLASGQAQFIREAIEEATK